MKVQSRKEEKIFFFILGAPKVEQNKRNKYRAREENAERDRERRRDLKKIHNHRKTRKKRKRQVETVRDT